jgi:hypothetical protein
MNNLPVISEGVVWSMMKSIPAHGTLRLIEEIADTNPVLLGCIKNFIDVALQLHGPGAAEHALMGMMIVCKVLDSQLEADEMNKEFV